MSAWFDSDEGRLIGEILAERRRQDDKFGAQNHPSIDPVAARPWANPSRYYGIPEADWARERCQQRANHGHVSWPDILTEEYAEAVQAAALHGEGPELRTELIQTAAVALAWVECIDRRATRSDDTGSPDHRQDRPGHQPREEG